MSCMKGRSGIKDVYLLAYLIAPIFFFLSFTCFGYEYLAVGSGGVALPVHGNFVTFGARPTTRNEIEVSGYLADSRKDNIDIRYRYYGFRYKRFFTESFYYAPGFGQRMIRGNLRDDEKQIESNRSMDSYGVEFSFGNVWQNERLRFGIDWIGYFHPLMSTAMQSSFKFTQSGKNFPVTSDTAYLREVRDQSQKDWNNSVWNRLADSGNITFMRLQLGYSF